MKLSSAKKKYKNQWIAFDIENEGDDPEGKVVAHFQTRQELYKKLSQLDNTNLYITFTGPILHRKAAMLNLL